MAKGKGIDGWDIFVVLGVGVIGYFIWIQKTPTEFLNLVLEYLFFGVVVGVILWFLKRKTGWKL